MSQPSLSVPADVLRPSTEPVNRNPSSRPMVPRELFGNVGELLTLTDKSSIEVTGSEAGSQRRTSIHDGVNQQTSSTGGNQFYTRTTSQFAKPK